MWGKGLALILLTLSVGSILIQPATGKEYPEKPIEIVCAYSPGSTVDIISRLVADTAKKYLGQPLVMVYKSGAGGVLAAAEVVNSNPDGYKLLSTLITVLFAIQTKTTKLPFDPSHLTPLVSFVEFRAGWCVRGDSPFKTFNDVLDYARKNPGKLRWAHTGRGMSPHITMTLAFKKAGVDAIDIPYKGTPEKMSALLGGHVALAQQGYASAKDLVEAGKIRFLFFNSNRRYSDQPGVPSAVEIGFPEMGNIREMVGFGVHNDTPKEIRKTLFDAFKKTYEDPEFKKQIEKIGEDPIFGDPELINERIKEIEEVCVPLLKEWGTYVGK